MHSARLCIFCYRIKLIKDGDGCSCLKSQTLKYIDCCSWFQERTAGTLISSSMMYVWRAFRQKRRLLCSPFLSRSPKTRGPNRCSIQGSEKRRVYLLQKIKICCKFHFTFVNDFIMHSLCYSKHPCLSENVT